MSYREVDPQTVKAACIKYMERYEQWVADMLEPIIQEEMAGTWRKKSKTREQAIKSLESDPFSDYYMIVRFRGRANGERKVEQLLALCNVPSTSSIHLDDEGANILSGCFPTSSILNG